MSASKSTLDLCGCAIRQDESSPFRCVKLQETWRREEMRPGHQHGCFYCYDPKKNDLTVSPFPGEDFTVLVSKLHLTRP